MPPSNHHPSCEDYQLVTYYRVRHNDSGPSMIVTKDEVKSLLTVEVESGKESNDFSISTVQLTADQFEKLPDLQGL